MRARVTFKSPEEGGRPSGPPPMDFSYRVPVGFEDNREFDPSIGRLCTCRFKWIKEWNDGYERIAEIDFLIDSVAESLFIGDRLVVREDGQNVHAKVRIVR